MAQRFTINETMVTQKVCNNCSWMKGISSYLHPFFLCKIVKKTTIATKIQRHLKIWLDAIMNRKNNKMNNMRLA